MDDLEWPRVVNKVITQRWSQLKNTLVMKDLVDYLIQKRVVTLDYWMSLKAKPVTESERTEDFLSLVMKFDQQKYQYFLEALLAIHREDLVKELLNAQNGRSRKKEKLTDRKGNNIPQAGRKRSSNGRTDIEQASNSPKPVAVKAGNLQNTKDGHNGSQETFSAAGKTAKAAGRVHTPKQSEETGNKQAEGRNQTDRTDSPGLAKQGSFSTMSKTDKLHHGIGTAVKAEVKSTAKAQDHQKQVKADNDQQNKDVSKEATYRSTFQGHDKSADTADKSIKDSDSMKTLRPDPTEKEKGAVMGTANSSKSKEELLEIKERELQSREVELDKKQNQLYEQEEQLKEKEKDLLTRENSLLTMRPTTSESLASPTKMLKDMQMGMVSFSSTTESSDVLADLREQLASMKKVQEEIESEHSTYCNTPKEEYVKLQDFQASQREIEELREEVATDRSNRKDVEEKVESLQCKVEDLKQEISELQNAVDKLQVEKEQTKLHLTEEQKKLKAELKESQHVYNEKLIKLETKMQAKDNECAALKSNIEDVVKTATELEDRVETLENEKTRQEQQLQEYQKEISFLKKEVTEKESEIRDLKRVLEETETEKDELIEVLAGLKKDVSTLKAEKRQLEQDKRTLIGRCAKPQWSVNTRRSTFK